MTTSSPATALQPDDFIPLVQYAALHGVTYQRAYGWVRHGRLSAERQGGKWWVRRECRGRRGLGPTTDGSGYSPRSAPSGAPKSGGRSGGRPASPPVPTASAGVPSSSGGMTRPSTAGITAPAPCVRSAARRLGGAVRGASSTGGTTAGSGQRRFSGGVHVGRRGRGEVPQGTLCRPPAGLLRALTGKALDSLRRPAGGTLGPRATCRPHAPEQRLANPGGPRCAA
jgi:hypothetical protein